MHMRDKNKYKMKGVNFNLDNPAEKRLWDYACSISSFSGFMKHLLTNHMAAGWESKSNSPVDNRSNVNNSSSTQQSIKSGSHFKF
jgi:hypothetical protein